MEDAKANLIRILQNAYSGEVAAAYAYRGHWKSLKEGPDRERIKRIEEEEWDHRRRVGDWLETLGSAPRPAREKGFLDNRSYARSDVSRIWLVYADVFRRTS